MAIDATAPSRVTKGRVVTLLRWARRHKIAVASVVVIAVFYAFGILAQWIAPYDPLVQDFVRTNELPSADHWLGTDRLGRDLFSRVLYAMRTTVSITAATFLVGGGMLGVFPGLLAGYRGGWVDTAIMRCGEASAMLPGLLFMILVSATIRPRYEEFMRDAILWGPVQWLGSGGAVTIVVGGTFALLTALFAVRFGVPVLPYVLVFAGALAGALLVGSWLLSIDGFADIFLIFLVLLPFSWYGTARIIRALVLSLRERDFIVAARAMGATPSRIIMRHLFPNVLGYVIVGMFSGLASIAVSEIALTWLGIGVQPPHPSFGTLIADGGSIRSLQTTPHLLLVPGIIVAVLLFSFSHVGDTFGALALSHRIGKE